MYSIKKQMSYSANHALFVPKADGFWLCRYIQSWKVTGSYVGPHAAMSKLPSERLVVSQQSECIYSKIFLSELDLSQQ